MRALLLNLPDSHDVQSVKSSCCVAAVAASSLYRPEGQDVHAPLDACAEYFPAAQITHEEDVVLAWEARALPRAHALQPFLVAENSA